MINTLKNDFIELKIKDAGAELTSLKLKDDDVEYLWSANPKFWGRHAPILFPIVGRLKNDEYIINEESYNMSQHGFARDNDFEIIETAEDKVTYRLTYNESTLEKYPYKFQLDIDYILEENTLKIQYHITNKDDKEIYFSIGAHPGFNCPLFEGESMEDYYLEFEQTEIADTYLLEGPFISNQTENILNNQNNLNLSPKLFSNDALVFKDLKSESISIKSNKHDREITVSFPNFPYLGVWSKAERAPFICIEPWYGIADSINTTQILKEKEGIQSLGVGDIFSCYYSISII